MNKYLDPQRYHEVATDKYNKHLESPLQWLRLILRKPKALGWRSQWKQSLNGTTNSVSDGRPWITFEAYDWLNTYLQPTMRVFEWGSGGSTIFNAPRVEQVISVEHDTTWYPLVRAALDEQGSTNVEYVLHEPTQSTAQLDPSKPDDYASYDEYYPNMQFTHYVQAIDQFPDGHFDLIVVDGRARVSCLAHAVHKVKPGGYILLDNSERDIYEPGLKEYGNYIRTDYFGPGPYNKGFWQTSTFQRPL